METSLEPAATTKRSGWRRALPWCAALLVGFAALAVAVPNVLERFQHHDYHHAKWYRDLLALRSALDEYAVRNAGRYPAQLDELIAPDRRDGYRFLNESRTPLDPWRSPYGYLAPAHAGARPLVYSFGPDRRAGTDDDLRLDDE